MLRQMEVSYHRKNDSTWSNIRENIQANFPEKYEILKIKTEYCQLCGVDDNVFALNAAGTGIDSRHGAGSL